jgi:hypothetical protein
MSDKKFVQCADLPVWCRIDDLPALTAAITDGDGAKAAIHLSYYQPGNEEHWRALGHARVGVASVTFAPSSENDMVAAAVEALRDQQRKLRAEAEVGAQRIEKQIRQLLAIEWSGQ